MEFEERIDGVEAEGSECGRLLGGDADCDLGLDAEGAAIAEEQPGEVGSPIAVEPPWRASAHHRSVRQHNGEAENAVEAGGNALGRQPADGRMRAGDRAWLRRPHSVRPQRGGDVRPRGAGADDRVAIGDVDVDVVHPAGVEDHRGGSHRHAARVGEPRAARNQRHAGCTDDANHGGGLLGGSRAHHHRGGDAARRIDEIRRCEIARIRVVGGMIGADDCPELVEHAETLPASSEIRATGARSGRHGPTRRDDISNRQE